MFCVQVSHMCGGNWTPSCLFAYFWHHSFKSENYATLMLRRLLPHICAAHLLSWWGVGTPQILVYSAHASHDVHPSARQQCTCVTTLRWNVPRLQGTPRHVSATPENGPCFERQCRVTLKKCLYMLKYCLGTSARICESQFAPRSSYIYMDNVHTFKIVNLMAGFYVHVLLGRLCMIVRYCAWIGPHWWWQEQHWEAQDNVGVKIPMKFGQIRTRVGAPEVRNRI